MGMGMGYEIPYNLGFNEMEIPIYSSIAFLEDVIGFEHSILWLQWWGPRRKAEWEWM
jgi:hypothetical protein